MALLAFIGCVWGVFIAGHVLPFQLESFGITPRTLRGLVGIPARRFCMQAWDT